MTVQTIYPTRDIRPEKRRITSAQGSGQGKSFDEHLADHLPHCACCGLPETRDRKLYQYGMCKPCLTARFRGVVEPFLNTQRAEILGGR